MVTNEQAAADNGKNLAAVEPGRDSGLKGWEARAAKMMPEERKESAKKAAARWGKSNEDS